MSQMNLYLDLIKHCLSPFPVSLSFAAILGDSLRVICPTTQRRFSQRKHRTRHQVGCHNGINHWKCSFHIPQTGIYLYTVPGKSRRCSQTEESSSEFLEAFGHHKVLWHLQSQSQVSVEVQRPGLSFLQPEAKASSCDPHLSPCGQGSYCRSLLPLGSQAAPDHSSCGSP